MGIYKESEGFLMFRKVNFTIDNQHYSVVLIADDEIIVDEKNKVVFLNQTNWIVGEIPLVFPADGSVRVVTTHLSKQIFEEIIKGENKLLAHYLTSTNKYERDLATIVASYRLAAN